MIEALNIVKSAINAKHPIDALRHLRIVDQRVQASNGTICVDVAIDSELDITVPAERFIAAINICNSDAKITAKNDHLSVSCKNFRTRIPLIENVMYPRLQADGKEYPILADTLDQFNLLKQFVGDKIEWTKGILLSNEYAYATNTFVMVRAKMPFNIDVPVVVPVAAFNELVRIDKNPTSVKISQSSISFLFEDGFLRSQLIDAQWPDVVNRFPDFTADAVPEGLAIAVEQLALFTDDMRVEFNSDGIRTGETVFNFENLPTIAYNIEHLNAVLKIATHIDFTQKASRFKGNNIDGLIAAVRS